MSLTRSKNTRSISKYQLYTNNEQSQNDVLKWIYNSIKNKYLGIILIKYVQDLYYDI